MSLLPEAPEIAPRIVPNAEALKTLTTYGEFLAGPGVDRGLIGPREVPRLWDRHLLNCAVAAELVPAGAQVIDVGSGAGLPGMVWAIVRPDIRVICLEPLQRRTTFLEEIVDELALAGQVRVVRARAEDVVRGRGPVTSLRAGVVTARAVAALDKLANWTVPLLEPGGVLLALKGRSAPEEIQAARDTLSRLGVDEVEIVECGVGEIDPPTTVVRAWRAR